METEIYQTDDISRIISFILISRQEKTKTLLTKFKLILFNILNF